MKKSHSGKGWPRRDADEWAGLLAGQAQSGQSVKEFCAAQGISAASYYRWQKLLQAERESVFHPIEIATPRLTGKVEVELPGGVRLHLSELPPAPYLHSLSWEFNDGTPWVLPPRSVLFPNPHPSKSITLATPALNASPGPPPAKACA